PSPPPIGWSTGFMATPRTCGRRPIHRERPAFPILTNLCSALPTTPTVARQSRRNMRSSLEGMRTTAYPASTSFSSRTQEAPAVRTIWAPRPGYTSRLWISVPSGMWRSAMAFPGTMSSACVRDACTGDPAWTPCGATMYARRDSFSAAASYRTRAM
ncbi:hypothetical protein PBRA_006598, partial [Plasmodiophora brassicae]